MNPPDQPSPDRPFLPIESAPRDGTEIECKSTYWLLNSTRNLHWKGDCWGYKGESVTFRELPPTHWREILPVAEAGETKAKCTCHAGDIDANSHHKSCAIFNEPATAAPGASGTPRKWQEAYKRELEYSDRALKQCGAENDKYGKCFHEGRQSGLINIDIMAGQIFDALETELSAAQQLAWAETQRADKAELAHETDCGQLQVELTAARERAEQAEKERDDYLESMHEMAKALGYFKDCHDSGLARAVDFALNSYNAAKPKP